MPDEPKPTPRGRRSLRKEIALLIGAVLLTYLTIAYVIAPALWSRHDRRNPKLEDLPGITYTADGIPGDPINVALVGTKQELMRILVAAKWYPADPLSLKSCLEIAEATVLKRPYDAAPVSSLYLFGRREDLAFEQPVGDNPRHRHHVRFWRSGHLGDDGRPTWVGSAVYDRRVGFSRTTAQITHVTAANVDAERDYLFRDLERTGDLTRTSVVHDYHKVRQGRNGGGDPWFTDGDLYVGVIAGPRKDGVNARGGADQPRAAP